MYGDAAQFDYPPRYPVTEICGGIDGASFGSDILSKIYAGLVAYRGNDTCKVNGPPPPDGTQALLATGEGWLWQVIAFTSARCSSIVFCLYFSDLIWQ